MADLPFRIPESLASYLVQYESSPDKTIRRLEKQLKKRGPDPVGYFVLGWLYHRQGADEEAINCALKAKTFAPGSPFFEKLHYFFTHPSLFQAWRRQPAGTGRAGNPYRSTASGPILDLDSLIEKLSALDTRQINRQQPASSDSGSTLSPDSEEVDDIASETLAMIHEKQGKLREAINNYRKLKVQRPEKEAYYDRQIERLRKDINTDKED